jgi:acylaminoacyl-peptidase
MSTPSAQAGVLRNPVCNLSLMVGLSDISDWCFVETFGSEEGMAKACGVPSPEVLAAMFAKSPIAHVHKVRPCVCVPEGGSSLHARRGLVH